MRDQNLDDLSQLILALFGVCNRITAEFSKSGPQRRTVNLSLAIFLRSDIFHYLMRNAREPDKISASRILWSDKVSLQHVLDERFTASQTDHADAELLWRKFFTPTVNDIPIRDYLVSRILPRPRDLLYLTTAAIDIAINRGHSRVDESDVAEAEKQYSQFALDTIETEATAALNDPKNLLYEFIGAPEILDRNTLEALFANARIGADHFGDAMDL